jgi:hypothetical protein
LEFNIEENIYKKTLSLTYQEILTFVLQSTHDYEKKLNEYAKNKFIVIQSLSNWYKDLQHDIRLIQSRFKNVSSWTLDKIISAKTLTFSEKENLILMHIWNLFLSQHTVSLDHGHSVWPSHYIDFDHIHYYTIEPTPDGYRKMFQCKVNQFIISIPEILLRAIPYYHDFIHSFFILKFIPFKHLFISFCQDKHFNSHSTDSQQPSSQHQEQYQHEQDDYSSLFDHMDLDLEFQHPTIYEINPRVCYNK